MIPFGEQLRQEREARGISLASITQSTKISTRHLASLEENRFDQLPGGVFNKGIVRDYARALGLDESYWVESYMQAYRQSGKMKDDDRKWVEFAENVGRDPQVDHERRSLNLRWAGIAVLVAILAVSGWLIWQLVSSRTNNNTASHPTNSTSSSNPSGQALSSGS